jgi:7,8-dihydropterin-6-yl-methyl-4-(beta-D-ribofuranosyl)aminobenzene 5'-phosphate synthase
MVGLQPVDAVEITLVVDNFVDILLAGAEGVRRFPLAYDAFDADQLVAEHGFSALVTWSPWRRAAGAARSCTTAA